MARSRNIKPGFFANEDLPEIEPIGRLLFIGLWTIADREGRLEDRPRKIKGELLRFDNCDVDNLLQILHDNKFIVRYSVDGNNYIQICNFVKHQSPHPKEAPSEIPPIPQTRVDTECNSKVGTSQVITRQETDEPITSHVKDVASNAESLFSDSLQSSNPLIPTPDAVERLVVDNFAKEDDGSEGGALHSPDDNPDFMEFMSVYPRREEIGKAKKAWEKAVFSGAKPILIVGAARKYAAEMKAEGRETQYIKMPYNFILDQIPFEARCPTCELYSQCEGKGWYTVEVEYLGCPKTDTVPCPYKLKGAG